MRQLHAGPSCPEAWQVAYDKATEFIEDNSKKSVANAIMTVTVGVRFRDHSKSIIYIGCNALSYLYAHGDDIQKTKVIRFIKSVYRYPEQTLIKVKNATADNLLAIGYVDPYEWINEIAGRRYFSQNFWQGATLSRPLTDAVIKNLFGYSFFGPVPDEEAKAKQLARDRGITWIPEEVEETAAEIIPAQPDSDASEED